MSKNLLAYIYAMSVQVLHSLNHAPKLHFLFENTINILYFFIQRHTWATLAFNELSASTDDIAAALGHQHGSRITAIYINPDSRKVDALNRRMLDLIFAL